MGSVVLMLCGSMLPALYLLMNSMKIMNVQKSGVMEYWSIGVLVKIAIRFRPLTSDF
jgi:hypothetical protein